MRAFLQRLFQPSVWDSKGRMKYLLDRTPDATAFAIAEVPPGAVERVLRLFCDAFDILDEQMFCLRPSDAIHDIYRAMVTGTSDEMEYERLMINVEEAIGRKLVEGECASISTIEDLIRFVDERATAR